MYIIPIYISLIVCIFTLNKYIISSLPNNGLCRLKETQEICHNKMSYRIFLDVFYYSVTVIRKSVDEKCKILHCSITGAYATHRSSPQC